MYSTLRLAIFGIKKVGLLVIRGQLRIGVRNWANLGEIMVYSRSARTNPRTVEPRGICAGYSCSYALHAQGERCSPTPQRRYIRGLPPLGGSHRCGFDWGGLAAR